MAPLIELYGVSHEDLLRWVRQEFGLGGPDAAPSTNVHKLRRAEMAQRVRLYKDDAKADFEQLIEDIYEDKFYKIQLKKFIGVASSQNVTRRITDEVASLYDKPAVRTLKANNDKFKLEEKRLNLHEIWQEAHRLLSLCYEVLIWQFTGAQVVNGKNTKLRVVTPELFDVIAHPLDVTSMAGVLIDFQPQRIGLFNRDKILQLPHYQLWDDTYLYKLNALGQLVTDDGTPAPAPIEHGLKRIPGVLLHKREPMDRLLDSRPGRDIVSGHFAIYMLNMMMLRLSKSQGENQPVLQGNLANVAAGQPMNGESPIVLPPEVVASILQTKTEPDHYLKVKKELLQSLGQTYGLSYEMLTYEENNASTSGKAYQVRREKLTELRTEQRRRAMLNEAEVVDLMGFDPTGMKIDFSEQAIPQDAGEEVALLDLKMRLGLDSPLAYLIRKDPDLDRGMATKILEVNLGDFALIVDMMRKLNLPAGANAANTGNDPQINGRGNIVEKIDTAQLLGAAPANPASGGMTQQPPGGSGMAPRA